MPGECLRDVALGQRCWLRDGFDLGKLRRRSSTPAVVPGAAPALAKAGVGGFHLTPQLEGLEKEQGHPTRTLSFNSSHVYVLRFFSETGAGKHVPRCVMVDLAPWQSLVGSRQGGGGGGGGGDGDGDAC